MIEFRTAAGDRHGAAASLRCGTADERHVERFQNAVRLHADASAAVRGIVIRSVKIDVIKLNGVQFLIVRAGPEHRALAVVAVRVGTVQLAVGLVLLPAVRKHVLRRGLIGRAERHDPGIHDVSGLRVRADRALLDIVSVQAEIDGRAFLRRKTTRQLHVFLQVIISGFLRQRVRLRPWLPDRVRVGMSGIRDRSRAAEAMHVRVDLDELQCGAACGCDLQRRIVRNEQTFRTGLIIRGEDARAVPHLDPDLRFSGKTLQPDFRFVFKIQAVILPGDRHFAADRDLRPRGDVAAAVDRAARDRDVSVLSDDVEHVVLFAFRSDTAAHLSAGHDEIRLVIDPDRTAVRRGAADDLAASELKRRVCIHADCGADVFCQDLRGIQFAAVHLERAVPAPDHGALRRFIVPLRIGVRNAAGLLAVAQRECASRIEHGHGPLAGAVDLESVQAQHHMLILFDRGLRGDFHVIQQEVVSFRRRQMLFIVPAPPLDVLAAFRTGMMLLQFHGFLRTRIDEHVCRRSVEVRNDDDSGALVQYVFFRRFPDGDRAVRTVKDLNAGKIHDRLLPFIIRRGITGHDPVFHALHVEHVRNELADEFFHALHTDDQVLLIELQQDDPVFVDLVLHRRFHRPPVHLPVFGRREQEMIHAVVRILRSAGQIGIRLMRVKIPVHVPVQRDVLDRFDFFRNALGFRRFLRRNGLRFRGPAFVRNVRLPAAAGGNERNGQNEQCKQCQCSEMIHTSLSAIHSIFLHFMRLNIPPSVLSASQRTGPQVPRRCQAAAASGRLHSSRIRTPPGPERIRRCRCRPAWRPDNRPSSSV